MDSESLTDEFCYGQYSNSENFNSTDILPPVSNQGRNGTCTAHALACVAEGFNLIHHGILAMGGKDIGNLETVPLSGVGLYDNHEKMKEQQQFGVKFCLSRIDWYMLVSEPRSLSPTWKKVNLEKSAERKKIIRAVNGIKFDDIVKEIKDNGPVIASFVATPNFRGTDRIHTGIHPSELSETRRGHAVALIGWGGSGEKEEKYFIAQNSFGSKWGENGLFRLDPSCIRRVIVPTIL